MVKTEVKQDNFLERKGKSDSIFNHYSIENEAKFLRRTSHLSLEEREFYVRENILGFLGEYVGQLLYKKIAYFLKDNSPYFAGFPVLETYKNTALMAGTGSREWFEYLGFAQALQSLQEANINSATIISPSKIADYGFVFHFVKDSSFDLVKEYILRFPEKQGELGKSRRITRELSFENTDAFYQKAEDFLANPLLSFSTSKNGDLDRLFGIMGISKDEIVFSDRFEQAIINDDRIASWLKTYFQRIASFAEASTDGFDYQAQVKDLQFILAAIYNRAKDIKRDLSGGRQEFPIAELRMLMNLPIPSTTFDMNDYALKEEATISAGGGNCPTVKSNSSLVFITANDILEGLSTGKTIEQIINDLDSEHKNGRKTLRCTCPLCQEKVEAIIENGKIYCPKCHGSASYEC